MKPPEANAELSQLLRPGGQEQRIRGRFPRLLAVAGLTGLVVTAGLAPGVAASVAAANQVREAWNAQPNTIPAPALPGRTKLVDRKGALVSEVFSINRVPVSAQRQSPLIRQAVVAVEDTRFFSHHGIDAIGLTRALASIAAGDGVQGGSTITQQYAKNLRVTQAVIDAEGEPDSQAIAAATGRNWRRKVAEAHLALLLEARMSKDEILTGYLNVAYFGAGAYGVEAAAHRFFSTTASRLTLAQAALLAGLLQSPGALDPRLRPEAALTRRNHVLDTMATVGYISSARAEQTKQAGLGLRVSVPRQGCQTARPAWGMVCDAALRELRRSTWLGPQASSLLATGGLTVRLTVDPATQAASSLAAAQIVPSGHRVANAITMVEPGTGSILAMASNRRFGDGPGETEIPLATIPAFSPGSTFKLFTLAAALEEGVSLSTILPGGSSYTSGQFDNPPGGYHNAEGLSASNVDVRTATEMSINTAYVQLAEKVGIRAIADVARRLGIDSVGPAGSKKEPGAREGSFVLGTRDVSVTEMAGAYAAIANHGQWCSPTLIASVTLPGGAAIANPARKACRQAVDPAVADTVASVLAGVIENGTGRPAALPDRQAAGKTGTAEDAGAAWFAGFTPQAAAAVWTGDPRSPRYTLHDVLGLSTVYGGTLPAALWKDTMVAYLRDKPALPLPGVDPGYLLAPGPPPDDQVVMIDLLGQSAEAAARTLSAMGLKPVVTIEQAPGWVPAGTVTRQSKEPGALMAPGTAVRLQVAG